MKLPDAMRADSLLFRDKSVRTIFADPRYIRKRGLGFAETEFEASSFPSIDSNRTY